MADINFNWDYTEQQYNCDTVFPYYFNSIYIGLSVSVSSNKLTLKIVEASPAGDYVQAIVTAIDPSTDWFGNYSQNTKTYNINKINTQGIDCTIGVYTHVVYGYNVNEEYVNKLKVHIDYPKPITEYTLTYNSNGGVGGPASVRIPDYVGTISISNKVPTRNGYIFKCWNTAVNGGGSSYAYGDNIKLSNNITLYAIWQKMTIKLQYTGAGGATSSGADLYVEDTKWGERFYLASNQFERNCYRFIGWQLFRANAAQWLNTSNEWDSNYSNVKLLSEGDCIDTDIMSLGQATDGEYIIIYAQWERVVPKSYVFDGTEFKEVVSIKMFDGSTFKDIVDAKHF